MQVLSGHSVKHYFPSIDKNIPYLHWKQGDAVKLHCIQLGIIFKWQVRSGA